jgi:hypothetical protein
MFARPHIQKNFQYSFIQRWGKMVRETFCFNFLLDYQTVIRAKIERVKKMWHDAQYKKSRPIFLDNWYCSRTCTFTQSTALWHIDNYWFCINVITEATEALPLTRCLLLPATGALPLRRGLLLPPSSGTCTPLLVSYEMKTNSYGTDTCISREPAVKGKGTAFS